MKFEEESESLPLLLRAGSALQLNRQWLISFDVIAPKDNAPHAALGTEYVKAITRRLTLALRAGFNSRTSSDVDGFTGATLGTGLSSEHVGIDYALLPYGTLGLTHRISITIRWGAEKTENETRLRRTESTYISGEDALP
jgi:hypothetical protein